MSKVLVGNIKGPPGTGVGLAPSGDLSGNADLTSIQGLVNLSNGPVNLQSGIYYIDQPITLVNGSELVGVHDGGFGGAWDQSTRIQLVNASNSSMVVAPDGVNYWKLRNLMLNANGSAQTGPTQSGTTGACIHVADGATSSELQAELDMVYVQSPYNDALYLGVNRRSLRARWSKFMAAGTGNTLYGAGNGITCNYSDHVFYACSVGGNNHHGIYACPSNASAIRITDCDIFTNGQDWAAVTPTAVASGSNGVAVSGLTSAGVLHVSSTSGFPSSGKLLINVATGQVIVTYTGTSGGNTFTGVAVQSTLGNGGGTLATSQGVYILGGDGVHVGSAAAGISLLGNSMDRNNGSGVFVESAINSVKILGNRFLSNGQAANGLLPHINLVNANLQTSIVGNGMEPVVSGFTNLCSNFINANVVGSGWFDSANSWLFAQLSTSQYTNAPQGINPFSNGSFLVQSTNTGKVTSTIKALSGQTADLTEWMSSSGVTLAKINAAGQYYGPNNPVTLGADPTGAADSTVALNLALAVGGGVDLPAGTFLINGATALAMTTAGTKLQGRGEGATILKIGSSFSASQAISITADRCGVSDLSIVGTSTTVTSNPVADGIVFVGQQGTKIKDVFFQYINGWMIDGQGGASRASVDTMIRGITGRNCAAGLRCLGVTGSSFLGEYFVSDLQLQQMGAASGGRANLDAFLVQDVSDILANNINIGLASSQIGAAIHVNGACATVKMTNVDVGTNTIATAPAAILIDSGTNGSPADVSIINGGAEGGVAVCRVDAGNDIVLTNLRLHQAYTTGLVVNGGDVRALACSMNANNQSGGTGYDIDTSGMSSGNATFVNCQTESAVAAATAGSVTNPVNTSTHAYYDNCHFIGANTAPSNVFNGTPQRAVNNVGYNPRGSVTATTIGTSPFTPGGYQTPLMVIFTAINGMTDFAIGGVSVGLPTIGVPYPIGVRESMTVTYSGTKPTWVWFGM